MHLLVMCHKQLFDEARSRLLVSTSEYLHKQVTKQTQVMVFRCGVGIAFEWPRQEVAIMALNKQYGA